MINDVTIMAKKHILIVDDSATVRNSIAKHLGATYNVSQASDGQQAWQLIQDNPSISLIFADINMPVMNGIMLLKQIRDSQKSNITNLPVIMITGHEDNDAAKRVSYAMGATDFISKPFSATDIISRAGSYTKLNQKITTLEKKSVHDSVTELFNKRGFQEIGHKAISSANRHQHTLSVLIMQINDSDEIASKFGKKIIHKLIVAIAENLKKSLHDEDILAHFGSGRFAILLPMAETFKAHIFALRIQQSIEKLLFIIGDDRLKITLAVGLNSSDDYNHEIAFNYLCFKAERALHASLLNNKNNIIRGDELAHEMQHHEELKQTNSSHEELAEPTGELPIDRSVNKNIIKENYYITEIINGDFERIPTQHIEHLIKPLESFLNYAYKHIQCSKKTSRL